MRYPVMTTSSSSSSDMAGEPLSSSFSRLRSDQKSSQSLVVEKDRLQKNTRWGQVARAFKRAGLCQDFSRKPRTCSVLHCPSVYLPVYCAILYGIAQAGCGRLPRGPMWHCLLSCGVQPWRFVVPKRTPGGVPWAVLGPPPPGSDRSWGIHPSSPAQSGQDWK